MWIGLRLPSNTSKVTYRSALQWTQHFHPPYLSVSKYQRTDSIEVPRVVKIFKSETVLV